MGKKVANTVGEIAGFGASVGAFGRGTQALYNGYQGFKAASASDNAAGRARGASDQASGMAMAGHRLTLEGARKQLSLADQVETDLWPSVFMLAQGYTDAMAAALPEETRTYLTKLRAMTEDRGLWESTFLPMVHEMIANREAPNFSEELVKEFIGDMSEQRGVELAQRRRSLLMRGVGPADPAYNETGDVGKIAAGLNDIKRGEAIRTDKETWSRGVQLANLGEPMRTVNASPIDPSRANSILNPAQDMQGLFNIQAPVASLNQLASQKAAQAEKFSGKASDAMALGMDSLGQLVDAWGNRNTGPSLGDYNPAPGNEWQNPDEQLEINIA